MHSNGTAHSLKECSELKDNWNKMKSTTSATVDKAAKLGSSSGSSIDKRSNGGRVSGKEVELGNLIHKFNAEDQADMCLRTAEAIADFAGVECGRDMRMLAKKSNEKIFAEPLPPRAATDTTVPAPGRLEKCCTELMICHKDMKACTEQKAKVFVVILGQCSSEVKNKLVNNVGFETLEDSDDAVEALKMLKEMAFSTSGVQHPHWTLQNVLRRLTAINQGPSESVSNCHKRFLATAEVVEAGSVLPCETDRWCRISRQEDATQQCVVNDLPGWSGQEEAWSHT